MIAYDPNMDMEVIIADAHLDLAMNALRFRRGLTKGVYETRKLSETLPE